MNAKPALAALLLPAAMVACSDDSGSEPAMVAEAVQAAPVAPATVAGGEAQAMTTDPGAAMSNEPDQAALAAQAEARLPPQDATSGAEEAGNTAPTVSAAPAGPADTGAHPAVHHAAFAVPAHAAVAATHDPVDMGAAVVEPDPSAGAATAHAPGFAQLATNASVPTAIVVPQAPGGAIAQPMLLHNHVGISNLDPNLRVYFAVKPGQADWRNESLLPGHTGEIDCGVGECLFWMQTGSRPALQYRLRQQERYGIYWNRAKGIWDFGVRNTGGN
jgi:hypothetical protein